MCSVDPEFKSAEREDAPKLSVIVPVLNEEQALPAFLDAARSWPDGCELVFSDGDSTDKTLQILQSHTVVRGARGRGAQCRLGARASHGEALAFMHVDCIVGREAIEAIMCALAEGAPWGCLTLEFAGAGPMLAFGALMSNLRVKATGIPFGDQVMFMTRALYDEVGGMPEMALMEDYELSRRLSARIRPKQLPAKVVTSARRFKVGGTVRTMVKMRHLRHLYRAGVPVNELARMYGEGR